MTMDAVKDDVIELLSELHLDIKSLGDAVDELGGKLEVLKSQSQENGAVGVNGLVDEFTELHAKLDSSHDCIRQKSNILMTVVKTGSTEIIDNIVTKPDCH